MKAIQMQAYGWPGGLACSGDTDAFPKSGELLIRVVVAGSFPLEDAAEAQEAISGRETTGKVTLHVVSRR